MNSSPAQESNLMFTLERRTNMSRNQPPRTPILSQTDESVLAYIQANFGKKAADAYRERLVSSATLPARRSGSNRARSRSRQAS